MIFLPKVDTTNSTENRVKQIIPNCKRQVYALSTKMPYFRLCIVFVSRLLIRDLGSCCWLFFWKWLLRELAGIKTILKSFESFQIVHSYSTWQRPRRIRVDTVCKERSLNCCYLSVHQCLIIAELHGMWLRNLNLLFLLLFQGWGGVGFRFEKDYMIF